MPKVKIEFNLPEEREEHMRTVHADDLCSFIWDFQQYLRQIWKYENLDGKTSQELINEIWEAWHDKLTENNIDIDSLWS